MKPPEPRLSATYDTYLGGHQGLYRPLTSLTEGTHPLDEARSTIRGHRPGVVSSLPNLAYR